MPSSERFAAVDGGRLYFEECGSGLPVVLVHGFSLDTRMWSRQQAAFSSSHRVIAYDVRGFGRSSAPGEAGASHAEDLEALLAERGVDTAAVVGLSMGGIIAADFACRFPERLAALVLVDAACGGFTWSEAFLTDWLRFERLAEHDVAAARRAWLESALFRPTRARPALREELDEIVEDYSGWHWVHRIPVAGEPATAERLCSIQAPTLVVVGEHDIPDFHASAGLFCDRIGPVEKAVIRAAGHLPNMEQPDAFNRLVLGFLSRVLGSE